MRLNQKLINSCITSNLSNIEYLVSQGADIHQQNEWPICIAINFGKLEIVKYLVSQGADIECSSVIGSLKTSEYPEVVNYLTNQIIKKKLLAVESL